MDRTGGARRAAREIGRFGNAKTMTSIAPLALVLIGLAITCRGWGASTPAAPAGGDAAALLEQAQRSVQAGAYGPAAQDLEKAAALFRHQGNTNAEISATLSL